MTLEQFLDHRYQVTGRLPAFTSTHQRYVVQPSSGTSDKFVLSFCDYAKSLSDDAVEKQRRAASAMARPPVALLCRVIESSFERDFQWVISEFPGETSLRELLQQRQSLSMEEVEAFLRLLTEACESAASLGWPRLELDAAHLYLDGRLGLPRIPAPDVPLFESAGSDSSDYDPLQTMQFNAADIRGATDPIPRDTHDYVLPLGALCCDLLGQPQTMRGGNARYQPVPQLTSQQNVLLRRALTSESRGGFPSAKRFMDEFFGVSMHHSLTAHTEALRGLTATIPIARSETKSPPTLPQVPPPLSQATMAIAAPVHAIHARVTPSMPSMAPVTSLLTVGEIDKAEAAEMSTTLRLRLVPGSDEAPIFALVADEWVALGRSAADADFIAQFRPRSNVNDGRSRRISRMQARVCEKDGKLILEESSAVNPTVLHDAPISGHVEMSIPNNFLLAGEYPIEARAMPTDYNGPREIRDWTQDQSTLLHGSLIFRAGGSGVLLCEAAIVYSDVGIHFSKTGRPWFRAEAGATPSARIHRLAGQFWLEPIETSTISVSGGGEPASKAHHLVLLRDGMKLRLGPYAYTIQTYSITTNITVAGMTQK